MTAASRQVAITNQRGLHARASAKFVNLASQIDAKIEVEKDGHRVCGTSIMGLMMLGAAMGDSIVIHVEGDPRSPINQGTLCPKGAATLGWMLNPNRLTHVKYRT